MDDALSAAPALPDDLDCYFAEIARVCRDHPELLDEAAQLLDKTLGVLQLRAGDRPPQAAAAGRDRPPTTTSQARTRASTIGGPPALPLNLVPPTPPAQGASCGGTAGTGSPGDKERAAAQAHSMLSSLSRTADSDLRRKLALPASLPGTPPQGLSSSMPAYASGSPVVEKCSTPPPGGPMLRSVQGSTAASMRRSGRLSCGSGIPPAYMQAGQGDAQDSAVHMTELLSLFGASPLSPNSASVTRHQAQEILDSAVAVAMRDKGPEQTLPLQARAGLTGSYNGERLSTMTTGGGAYGVPMTMPMAVPRPSMTASSYKPLSSLSHSLGGVSVPPQAGSPIPRSAAMIGLAERARDTVSPIRKSTDYIMTL
eukprot:m51a1_g8005 hypothetical protein (369) ;mRNA; r:160266-161541